MRWPVPARRESLSCRSLAVCPSTKSVYVWKRRSQPLPIFRHSDSKWRIASILTSATPFSARKSLPAAQAGPNPKGNPAFVFDGLSGFGCNRKPAGAILPRLDQTAIEAKKRGSPRAPQDFCFTNGDRGANRRDIHRRSRDSSAGHHSRTHSRQFESSDHKRRTPTGPARRLQRYRHWSLNRSAWPTRLPMKVLRRRERPIQQVRR